MPWDNTKGLSVHAFGLHLTIGPYGNGWTLYCLGRRIMWRPIDYAKTVVVNGRRVWGYPRIAALDLRRTK